TSTFGFETARHKGVEMVKALAEDAKTTSRWYIVVSMGRAAGHLALGVGKSAAAHVTVIPEEFDGRPPEPDIESNGDGKHEEDPGKVQFREIVDIIAGTMLKRRAMGKEYGIVVLAEGLIECIGVKRLKKAMAELAELMEYPSGAIYGKIELDPFGHPRLG